MTMAIDLDDYRKARALKLHADRCDGELRNLNWTPDSAANGVSSSGAAPEPSPQLPDDFVGADMRALVQRLRALASLI